jgi:hypothetical protein
VPVIELHGYRVDAGRAEAQGLTGVIGPEERHPKLTERIKEHGRLKVDRLDPFVESDEDPASYGDGGLA